MVSVTKVLRNIISMFTVVVFLMCCKSIDTYELNCPIPNHAWNSTFIVKGSFMISDTTSLYNMYVVLRHTDAYKYNNIWMNIGLQYPQENMKYKKVNLSLGSDQSGWEGTGVDDIWHVKKRLNKQPFKFQKSGQFRYSISNIMRDDPLLHVMSVGVCVEKSSN